MLALFALLPAGCGNRSQSPQQTSRPIRRLTTTETEDLGLNVPCAPEAITGIIDEHIATTPKGVHVRLAAMDTKKPQEYAWVIWGSRKPVVITTAPKVNTGKTSGITARALRRARTYIADRHDMRGKLRPKGWAPPLEHLASDHQLRSYRIHIVSIQCLDAKAERWRITAVPVRSMTQGGEIWMQFDRNTKVSASFGR